MIEHRVGRAKTPVWVLPDVLSPAECEELIKHPGWPPGHPNAYIARQQSRANELGAMFLPKLAAVPLAIAGWMEFVTYTKTRKPTAWHFDDERGRADFKVYAYLNDAPGTLFDRKAHLHVPGRAGTIVVFDLDLEHTGAPHPHGELKYLLGLRPITCPR